jgi:hypothetical protein
MMLDMVGRRGFGSPYTHQAWGVDVAEYLTAKANDEVVVCVQIESQEAVENLEEIAQTDGVGECQELFTIFVSVTCHLLGRCPLYWAVRSVVGVGISYSESGASSGGRESHTEDKECCSSIPQESVSI